MTVKAKAKAKAKANRAFLFNPQNDGALAANQEVYTPDRKAAELARRYAAVMWWLGDEEDVVLVPSLEVEIPGLAGCELAGPRLVTSLEDIEVKDYCPWGWSLNAARLFRDAGASGLPNLDFEALRQLSHRRTTIKIYQALQLLGLPSCVLTDAPDEITDLAQIRGDVWVKAPWSSSGRGVRHIIAGGNLTGLEGIIRRQGSLLMERSRQKVEDFAMLFRSDGSKVAFFGYSIFDCARGSAYSGNMLLTDLEIETRLGSYVPTSALRMVREALE